MDGQLEFSFMEELREQEKVEKLAQRRLPYYPHPRDDNQRLLNYQHDWLEKQDPKAWTKLWNLAQKVARRMIRAQARRRGFYLDELAVDDRTSDAVCYVLRRYQYGWYVKKAYLKAIKEGVVHALWYRTLADESQESQSEDVMALYKVHDKDPFDEERALIRIEGMTREQAVARIRREFLPKMADMLLANIDIIGGVSNEKKRDNQGGADA
jgi:hypothetical protein